MITLTKSSSKEIIKKMKSMNQIYSIPFSFNTIKKNIKIGQDKIYLLNHFKEIEIPISIIHKCNQENISYYYDQELNLFKPLLFEKEKMIFKLIEPNLEHHFQGPILDINNTKMHISKGYKNCFEFSKKLVESCIFTHNNNVLDLFFGLGYCTKESLKLEAKMIYSFEKYKQVIQLAELNSSFSPNLKDKRLKLFCEFDHQKNDLFQILEKSKMKFDAVIIDPPKFDVLIKIYSSEFLLKLSKFIKSGSFISCYVPNSTLLKLKLPLENIIHSFHSTNQYKFLDKMDDFIYRFQRI